MFPRSQIVLRRKWETGVLLQLSDIFYIKFFHSFLSILISIWFLIDSLGDWYGVFLCSIVQFLAYHRYGSVQLHSEKLLFFCIYGSKAVLISSDGEASVDPMYQIFFMVPKCGGERLNFLGRGFLFSCDFIEYNR